MLYLYESAPMSARSIPQYGPAATLHTSITRRDGQLQQVDTPQTLFDSPVNLFVASFIGSPAMNIVSAELVRDDGPAVTFAGHKLPLPASLIENKPGLDGYFGREVILGVRPSDFEDAELADPTWARMSVRADVTEEEQTPTETSRRT